MIPAAHQSTAFCTRQRTVLYRLSHVPTRISQSFYAGGNGFPLHPQKPLGKEIAKIKIVV
jgi:hypothetical protein